MLRKTEEIKGILTAIVTEKEGRERQREAGPVSHGTAPTKGNRKEHAEDAYRSIFMKTLKARKENINKLN